VYVSSKNPVNATDWTKKEPNNYGRREEDCVHLWGDTAKWNDLYCNTLKKKESVLGFKSCSALCQMEKDILNPGTGDQVSKGTLKKL
jgi:hypothetical protein